jgi:hypothetical protein
MSDDTSTVEKPAEGAQSAPAGMPSALPEAEITRLTDEIVTALKTVYDPEIPADIYEIGLIYRIDIADDRTVKVDMSLTSPKGLAGEELAPRADAHLPGGLKLRHPMQQPTNIIFRYAPILAFSPFGLLVVERFAKPL